MYFEYKVLYPTRLVDEGTIGQGKPQLPAIMRQKFAYLLNSDTYLCEKLCHLIPQNDEQTKRESEEMQSVRKTTKTERKGLGALET